MAYFITQTVPPSITCLTCRFTSYHPEDVRQKYCGCCHAFHESPSMIPKPDLVNVAAAIEEALPPGYTFAAIVVAPGTTDAAYVGNIPGPDAAILMLQYVRRVCTNPDSATTPVEKE